ncbi:hypothetical protein N5T78_07040 [Aliarcobacter cryaerophilus]|uniref:hypothetical protein n=1 Tax=Aliarcobacter cryaerophilus TaxID=28198 RepID=UPI0021B53256|nr:hypothetical protein [Aliarcobacter cryaerophilus]MCT7466328.1 hypothetical protein [Aliarcobacter cryaerophilus]
MENSIYTMTLNIEILRNMKIYNQDYQIKDLENLAKDVISKNGRVVIQQEYSNAIPDHVVTIENLSQLDEFLKSYFQTKN